MVSHLFPRGFTIRRPHTLDSGKIVYAHVLGQGVVFLNTPEACTDLLDKRGQIYSDKPRLVMCGDLYVSFNLHYPWFMFPCRRLDADVATWSPLRDTATR